MGTAPGWEWRPVSSLDLWPVTLLTDRLSLTDASQDPPVAQRSRLTGKRRHVPTTRVRTAHVGAVTTLAIVHAPAAAALAVRGASGANRADGRRSDQRRACPESLDLRAGDRMLHAERDHAAAVVRAAAGLRADGDVLLHRDALGRRAVVDGVACLDRRDVRRRLAARPTLALRQRAVLDSAELVRGTERTVAAAIDATPPVANARAAVAAARTRLAAATLAGRLASDGFGWPAQRATAARPTPAAAATPRRTFAAEMSCLIVCSSCCFVVSCFCTLCLLLSALSSLKLCVY